MIPPETGATGGTAATPPAPAVSVCLHVMSQRADFLRAAQGRRQSMPAFTLQARRRGDDSPVIRVGYTCSKKVGNAVTRNRAKRRLRELARAILPATARPGWDYVLVGRPGTTVERTFALMLDDLSSALTRIHAVRAPK